MVNQLFYGDNLDILRRHIKDETVDLIYLDPPFNSQATYNVLFRSPAGERSRAQIEAFDDTWHWNESSMRAFDEVMTSGNTDAADMLRAMRSFLHDNDMMAYLAMMAVRLLELHRALKPTGSLYLHCDPTVSHDLNRDSPDGHHHRHRRCRSETRRSTGRVPEAAILTVKRDRRCFHAPRHLVAAGSAGPRRMALPSTAAIIWLPPVMSPAWVTHAAGRCGAGSRRTAPAARRPRPAGRPRTARAARSGRRS